jgi:hypothetical protein
LTKVRGFTIFMSVGGWAAHRQGEFAMSYSLRIVAVLADDFDNPVENEACIDGVIWDGDEADEREFMTFAAGLNDEQALSMLTAIAAEAGADVTTRMDPELGDIGPRVELRFATSEERSAFILTAEDVVGTAQRGLTA